MIFHAHTDSNNNDVLELDTEGIEFLIRGLQVLLVSEPGTEVIAPSLVDVHGKPEGVAEYVLRRVE